MPRRPVSPIQKSISRTPTGFKSIAQGKRGTSAALGPRSKNHPCPERGLPVLRSSIGSCRARAQALARFAASARPPPSRFASWSAPQGFREAALWIALASIRQHAAMCYSRPPRSHPERTRIIQPGVARNELPRAARGRRPNPERRCIISPNRSRCMKASRIPSPPLPP